MHRHEVTSIIVSDLCCRVVCHPTEGVKASQLGAKSQADVVGGTPRPRADASQFVCACVRLGSYHTVSSGNLARCSADSKSWIAPPNHIG